MAQVMAGLLWRAVAVPIVRPPGALPRCLTVTQRSLHGLPLSRGENALPQTCLRRLSAPQNTSAARTRIGPVQGCRHPLLCQRQSRRLFSSFSAPGKLIGRTLLGAAGRDCAPAGLGRALRGAPLGCRWISREQRQAWKHRNKSVMLYGVAMVVLITGFSYAAVPLYAVFCQATGLGGQATKGHDIDLVEDMVPVRGRSLSIRFNADTAASMRWSFRPQQLEIKLVPGETALAFYSAVNPTDKPITGISTYNVVPFEAGQYFNKIQCFCFEEQRLNPHEQVDMPVFFYIDPEFAEDPKMAKVDSITLSYTFFEAKEGLVLPDPFTRPALATA